MPSSADLKDAQATVEVANPDESNVIPEAKIAERVEELGLGEANDAPFPLADPGDYYEGLWCGIPNYKCPYCIFATLEGSGAVELHILSKIDIGDPRHMKAMELQEGGLG